MAAPFIAACVQTNSGPEPDANIAAVTKNVREARAMGADFVLLPETVGMMEPDRVRRREKAVTEEKDQALAAFRELAVETQAWLLVGSLVVRMDGGRLANRSFLIDGAGTIQARYDKIHMFDVDLGGGEVYRESASYAPGRRAVMAATPWGVLGMTICYDLRFAYLYRDLAKAGADFISVPSAFTRTTGKAHWHVLLRSRAIETGCFVLAPAQCGQHEGGRHSDERLTYGHSLIVDPWGEVLADGGEDVGVVSAEIDRRKIASARGRVPALTHDRTYEGP